MQVGSQHCLLVFLWIKPEVSFHTSGFCFVLPKGDPTSTDFGTKPSDRQVLTIQQKSFIGVVKKRPYYALIMT